MKHRHEPPSARPTTAVMPGLLISQEDAPAFLGISRAAFFRLKSAGELPRAVVSGGVTTYRRRELERWVERLPPIPERRPRR